MSDINPGSDDDGCSSDSDFSDFVPANRHGPANAGGPKVDDAAGYSSGEQSDTD